MQLTLLSVAAAMATTVSADASIRNAVTLNKACDTARPYARIINRCDYPVNLWSVFKGDGCPTDQMVTLNKGEIYAENYAMAQDTTAGQNGQGVSIKISKTEQCKGNDITQLEYFMDNREKTPVAFQMNYLDVSYVDCLDGDCPSKKEGYYLQVGTKSTRALKATTDNSWCPILSCNDATSCAKMSYILPDDIQTKTCDLVSSMDFYLCGSQAPSADDNKPASSQIAPAPTPQKSSTPAPKPSTTAQTSASSADDYKVKAAAVTPVADVKDAAKGPKVKTKTVIVTAYEYVNAKRSEHAHRHARRHQPFNA